jgi:hypothetical protein
MESLPKPLIVLIGSIIKEHFTWNSTYLGDKMRIRVRDVLLGTPGVHDRPTQFILTEKPTFTITSSNTLYANEGVNKTNDRAPQEYQEVHHEREF